jgi:tetratricopeptide (TPR) repeat protein
MSHTIGQIQEDKQKLKATQNQLPSEDKKSESVIVLSDADYEFLFNQLLEGVAHGWHNRRIVKFFNQLGDRGKQEDWVIWLERLRTKIITLPIQSKRQLGTIMVRLGELTQSTPEISQIGTVSNRIGRELLFGNIKEDIVWEYVGADLSVDSLVVELETEENLSERLPKDFAELGAIDNAPSTPSQEAIDNLNLDNSTDLTAEGGHSQALPLQGRERVTEIAVEKTVDNLPLESTSPTSSTKMSDESAIKSSSAEQLPIPDSFIPQEPNNTEVVSTDNDEFEFELNSQAELVDAALAQSQTPEEQLTPQQTLAQDPVAIDINQVISLIQEDEELAQKISQKLNLSPTNLDNLAESSSENQVLAAPANLDRTSIDLIEGWFNLGLKQVSGGEFEQAIASWEKALNINPYLSEAWHNRGSALGRLSKYQEAVESFQKALTIDPKNYQAWNDRAHALYQLQNWAAAADSWSNAIKITPGNHLFWYNRGCALEQLKSWEEAIASFEKSLEIKPDFQPARSRYTNLIADNSHSN